MCFCCGQVMSAVKMPGGQLPWDTDVDTPVYKKDYDESLKRGENA